MHIVFIVGSYFPYYSAVGKCIGNVADELSKENKVTVICQKSFNNQDDIEVFNNQHIIRVNTKDNFIRNMLNEKMKKETGVKKIIYKIVLIIYKSLKIIMNFFSLDSINRSLVKEYLRAIQNINEPIEIICPACMPFESIVAASNLKKINNSKTKIIPYLFDQFSESETIYRFKFNKIFKKKKNIELEKEVFENSYKVLAMHSLKDHFNRYFPCLKNIRYIEHPLLIRNSGTIDEVSNKNMTISYIGGLYKGYVEADYLLEIYRNSTINNSILNFYIIGNCFNIVNRYAKLLPEKIINHGSVDKEIANKQILISNILISIAEKNGIQMSSKIFEYISNGKPIIHFYTADNDVNLKILNKYPLSLCLKQDYELIEENTKKFDEFCKKNYKKVISFNEIEERFYDANPKYTADIINKY
ncbi:hypothetical protein [Clostridium sp.]|uniref:hypothetical protein n=1 Tax=Clostridium sp. TaxID=1506 RepID=UPI0029124B68|nr:hypothetical protein [Clostridium sp.]MDU5108229.1 hypothetical protein [Clostridium sp.]